MCLGELGESSPIEKHELQDVGKRTPRHMSPVRGAVLQYASRDVGESPSCRVAFLHLRPRVAYHHKLQGVRTLVRITETCKFEAI